MPGTTIWHTADLSALTHAPIATSDPAAFVRSDRVNSVAYRATGGHIHELYLRFGTNSWRTGDLSGLTGAPAAAGAPAGYVRSDKVNSVVYSAADGHIRELYLPFGAGAWGKGDLSALTGAPVAASDPVGYVRSDHVNSVVYRSADGHVREVYLRYGAGAWGAGDLSMISGSPAAAGNPAAYIPSDNSGGCCVSGKRPRIHEISLSPCGGGWRARNLSLLTGAPPAI